MNTLLHPQSEHAGDHQDVLVNTELDRYDMTQRIQALLKDELTKGFDSYFEQHPGLKQQYDEQAVAIRASYDEEAEDLRRQQESIDSSDWALNRELDHKIHNSLQKHQEQSEALADSIIDPVIDRFPKEEILTTVTNMFVEGYMPEGSERRTQAEDLISQMDIFEATRYPERLDSPSAIVTVPIAIHGESTATITRTLEQLQRQKGIDSTEIVLFANAPESQEITARDNYLALLDTIEQKFPGLHIRPCLKLYEDQELRSYSMMRIRSDYMDAVMLDLHQQERSIHTPIVWIDADTVSMPTNTLDTLVAESKNMSSLMIAPRLRYSVEGFRADTIPDPNTAIGATALYELARRTSKATGIYTEEAGLTIQACSYALAGGIDRNQRKDGESHSIGMGIYHVGYIDTPLQAPFYDEFYRRSIPGMLFGKQNNRIFAAKTKHIDGARMYVSARRQVERFATMEGHRSGNGLDSYDFKSFHEESYRGEQPKSTAIKLPVKERDAAILSGISPTIERIRSSEDPNVHRVVKRLRRYGVEPR